MKMKRHNMDFGEHVHGLNLLCGAELKDDELRIAFREVDMKEPGDMYKNAKSSLNSLTNIGSGFHKTFNNFRSFNSSFRGNIMDSVLNIFNIFINILVEFQKIVVKLILVNSLYLCTNKIIV